MTSVRSVTGVPKVLRMTETTDNGRPRDGYCHWMSRQSTQRAQNQGRRGARGSRSRAVGAIADLMYVSTSKSRLISTGSADIDSSRTMQVAALPMVPSLTVFSICSQPLSMKLHGATPANQLVQTAAVFTMAGARLSFDPACRNIHELFAKLVYRILI